MTCAHTTADHWLSMVHDSKVASGLDDFNLRRQDLDASDAYLPELLRRAQPHDLSLGWVES